MLEKDINMDIVLGTVNLSDPHRAKGSIPVHRYPCSFGGIMDPGCGKTMNIDIVLIRSWDLDVTMDQGESATYSYQNQHESIVVLKHSPR